MRPVRFGITITYNNKKNHLKSIIVKCGFFWQYKYTSSKNKQIKTFAIIISI